MALRTPLFLGNPAVQHSAQNDRLGLHGAVLLPEVGSTATNRPLTSRGGALIGPPGTMGEVTLLSNAAFTINPARFMIPGSAGILEGVYEVINDAVSPNLPITAQDATQWRRGYVGVWVRDSFPGNAGPDDGQYGVQAGALAPSNPALPLDAALPANFLKLGELLIPPVGQNVTFTPYLPRTGLRGGIFPVLASDTAPGPYVGAYRDHPTWGLQRWTGAFWRHLDLRPGFSAVKLVNQVIGASWQLQVCETLRWPDPWGQYDVATGVWTVPFTGNWRVGGAAAFSPSAAGARGAGFQARANSGAAWAFSIPAATNVGAPSASTATVMPAPVIEVPLTAGTQVAMFGYQSSGVAGGLTAYGSTSGQQAAFWAELIEQTA